MLATRTLGLFSGGLRVDGMVRGNVSALPDQPGTLVLSEHARIDGEVQVAHLVVNGTINGPVHAMESLELQAGARVNLEIDLIARYVERMLNPDASENA